MTADPHAAAPGACPPSGKPHRATWIAWPHFEPDWPGKLAPIPWVYGEIARVLADFEPVEILCHSEPVYENAGAILESHAVRADHIRLHLVPNDRTWLRDSAPTGVVDPSGASRCSTGRSTRGRSTPTGAWTRRSAARSPEIAQLPRVEPTRPDNGAPMVLEGGGIETNGAGLLLVTEEWLLSGVQVRNPGLTREGYEQAFREWLGARTDDLARRRLRGRRHARPRRRHRAVRLGGHDRPRGRRRIRPTRTTRSRWTTSGGWSSPRAIRRSGR